MTTIEIPDGASTLNITQEGNRILLEFAPKFKEGDFLYSDAYGPEIILIFKKIYNNRLYYYVSMEDGDFLDFCELNYWTNIEDFRLATEVEQQQLTYRLKKDGKQWNAETLKVEDIEPLFKKGDILTAVLEEDVMLIFDKYESPSMETFESIYCTDVNLDYGWHSSYFRPASKNEIKYLHYILAKDGKQWNAEKLCIEDIPQKKFNPGDKVKLKDGVLDKRKEYLYFTTEMDKFIGKELTVWGYSLEGSIRLKEAGVCLFAEDWLELYSDEPIIEELAIFWDGLKERSRIGIYKGRNSRGYYLLDNIPFLNAIKFESKEQFLEHIKD